MRMWTEGRREGRTEGRSRGSNAGGRGRQGRLGERGGLVGRFRFVGGERERERERIMASCMYSVRPTSSARAGGDGVWMGISGRRRVSEDCEVHPSPSPAAAVTVDSSQSVCLPRLSTAHFDFASPVDVRSVCTLNEQTESLETGRVLDWGLRQKYFFSVP